MNNLIYIDKSGAVGTFENVVNVASGKAQPIEFHTAIKRTFFGSFVVNITETLGGFKLGVSVPPEKFNLCSPVTYCLDGWENMPTVSNAIYVAHRFIERKRTERIAQYKVSSKMYQTFRE